MRTSELIKHLAADLRPVKRLAPPSLLTLYWLAPVVVTSALLVLGLDRPDTARTLADPLLRCEVIASFVTTVLAAYAAFATSVPGRSLWYGLLPIPSLIALIAIIAYGAWGGGRQTDWIAMDYRPAWSCIFLLGAFAFLPGVMLISMLRRAAPILPERTAVLAAIATASFSVLMLRLTLFHPNWQMPEMLTEHLGVIVLMTVAAMEASKWLLPMPRSCPGENGLS